MNATGGHDGSVLVAFVGFLLGLLQNGFLDVAAEGRQGLGHFGFVAGLEGGGQRRSVRLLGVCDKIFASHCCFTPLSWIPAA